ncbi:MAG: FAD-dependent oxidoreductase [Lysobacterales bacterium]
MGLLSRAVKAEQQHWDYIIVGAGTAGLSAAIAASRRGASVLLVDAAEKLGGTLNLAMGQICAAGSKIQLEQGIKDSPDQHYEDVMRLSRNRADPDIIRTTVDNAADTINWLLDGGLKPLPGHPVKTDTPGRPAYSVPRYLWAETGGRAILKVALNDLAPELDSGRVVSQLNTRVTGLLTSDAGAVEGVQAKLGDQRLAFRGRHVILTSGGYSMNPQLFERLVKHPAYAGAAYPHSKGDGLQLAVSVGGWLRGQDLHRAGTGSILSDNSFEATYYGRFDTRPEHRQPWEIWVNAQGNRFIREDEPELYARAMAVVEQPELRYAIVFDQSILDAAPVGINDWSREKLHSHFNDHPMFSSAQSLPELAQKAGVSESGLVASVDQYNNSVRNGTDPLGRTHLPLPIQKPPFYAITHLGSSATSSAGVVVDKQLRVLRGNGEPVPNLYAAGEVLGAGTTLGSAFVPGMMLTPALTLGRLLGERLPV